MAPDDSPPDLSRELAEAESMLASAESDAAQAWDLVGQLSEFIKGRVHSSIMFSKGGYHGRRIYLEAEELIKELKL